MIVIANYDDNNAVIGCTREDGVSGGLDFLADCEDLGMTVTYKTGNELLSALKEKKISVFSRKCEQDIVGGFQSDALAVGKWYQSDRDDQLNLIGVVTDGNDDVFKCGTEDADFVNNGVIHWAYEPHTIAQLKQVLNDGKNVKQTTLAKFYTKKAEIEIATDEAGVNAVVW